MFKNPLSIPVFGVILPTTLMGAALWLITSAIHPDAPKSLATPPRVPDAAQSASSPFTIPGIPVPFFPHLTLLGIFAIIGGLLLCVMAFTLTLLVLSELAIDRQPTHIIRRTFIVALILTITSFIIGFPGTRLTAEPKAEAYPEQSASELIRWSHDRYGLDLTTTDADKLLKHRGPGPEASIYLGSGKFAALKPIDGEEHSTKKPSSYVLVSDAANTEFPVKK